MGQIRKIWKHKEKWDRSGKFKNKQEGKNGGKKKKRIFTYMEVPILVCGGSHTGVFSIGGECPRGIYNTHVTLPQENPLEWEPSLQLGHSFSPSFLPFPILPVIDISDSVRPWNAQLWQLWRRLGGGVEERWGSQLWEEELTLIKEVQEARGQTG